MLLAFAACGTPSSATAPDGGSDPDVATADGSIDAATADIAAWHAHADDALETLLLRYWTPGAAYLGAIAPANGSVTQYWTFAQALDAVLDGVERTNGARFTGWIEALYLAQDAKGWSRDYYDDENWMALALIRAYDLEHAPKYLAEAKALYADIEAAWDTTCCGAHPGGIWWDRPHTQKATAANAGAVITGAQLAQRTGDASYLTFAKKVYAFWRANMVDPTTFAVSDHIAPNGTVTNYKFTYNEGLMIGAALALGEADDANHIADYMLAKETKAGILNDGTNTGCSGDCQQFKGIGFRYLAQLGRADVDAMLAASAQSIWANARATDGRFAADWAGPPTPTSTIDADSSATMALNIYAASLGAYTATTSHHQAEDGVVHAIGLEASHAGFGGWGYLAGWNADGQWVDFSVSVATAGTYKLAIRYAAAAGDAARLVYVNGKNAVAAQPFPATATWDAWATATVSIALPAGASAISLIYNASLGSKSYLNLDWIDVSP